MRTPWASNELREFLKQDEHLAPKGFVTRVLKICYTNGVRPITTVEQLRRSKIVGLPNIGVQTERHLRYLINQYAGGSPTALTFSTLRYANAARQKEWDPNKVITLEFRGNELAGEVGEACNIIKKMAQKRLGLRGKPVSTAQLADELADVIMCADLVAFQADIDLAAAVVKKFNATSVKHKLRTKLG
jgi:NTP pyrophosphatase (non-canonical NTP hydrolase)